MDDEGCAGDLRDPSLAKGWCGDVGLAWHAWSLAGRGWVSVPGLGGPVKVKGKVTPAMRRRVLELHGEGRSLRQIEAAMTEAGTPLSRTGAADLIRAAGALRGGSADPTPPGSPRGEAVPTPSTPPYDSPAPLEVPLPELPPDASVSARLIWLELLETREAAKQQYKRVLVGEFPMTQWVAAKTHILRLMKTLEETLPPPKPDPSKDPTNIAAREMVHSHVLRTIRAAEDRAGRLCPECRRAVRSDER